MLNGSDAPGIATLMDGRVLVAGGVPDSNAGIAINVAEVYDPLGDTWTTVSPMLNYRAEFGLSTLHGGQVLAAGGCIRGPNDAFCEYGCIAMTELYSPVDVPQFSCVDDTCVKTGHSGQNFSQLQCESTCGRSYVCFDGKCALGPYGAKSSYPTADACTANCATCTRQLGPGFEYNNNTACELGCVSYTCDRPTGRCVSLPFGTLGPFSDYGTCESACFYFACDADTSTCTQLSPGVPDGLQQLGCVRNRLSKTGWYPGLW
eukprot:m.17284 g.17284  ORF g.17284 m.17284 type:complete len:261 (-) comp9267_c0_seq1:982-1764(-)